MPNLRSRAVTSHLSEITPTSNIMAEEDTTIVLSAADFPTTPFSGIIDLNTESGNKLYLREKAPLSSTENPLSSTQTPYQQFMDYIKSDSIFF